ncbi:hypothetical protein ARALYDRAFT_497456 [Arabidopsis lyrata subsp. lyrata]|uniref:Uncharacterized protein n=1 Tax=Arabidopsis lyrata subsp. lyrata TaxID=81972 RepID=D7MXP0_ARALL|nr:hypothetical protein ARALYDRAFT_497456 [Arabidopsis lyrata subsp. lyrata]
MAAVSLRNVVVVMAVVLVTVQVFAQGYPEADLVVRLPGQLKVAFRQYAGYVDLDMNAGRSLFYYFVEAEEHPDTKPLTLWLNGGPGCSSGCGGAFTELGPFYPTGDGGGLRHRTCCLWSDRLELDGLTPTEALITTPVTSLLPAICSCSCWDGSTSSQSSSLATSFSLVKTMQLQFTLKGVQFNIKGIAIGNPFLKLDRDVRAAFEFFWSHGMISDEVGHTIMSQCDFLDYTYIYPHNLSVACNDAIREAGNSITEYVNNYDFLLDICYPSIVLKELRLKQMATKMSMGVDVCMTYERQLYFNLPEVQMALHANRTHLPYSWSMCSNLLNYSGIDANINMLPTLKRVIQNKIPVWIFSGDQDSVVPFLGTRTVVRELANDLNFKTTVPYGVWFHKRQVGGWAIDYGNILTFATVRGAAHAVANTQPSRALHLFSTFLRGHRLPNKTDIAMHD